MTGFFQDFCFYSLVLFLPAGLFFLLKRLSRRKIPGQLQYRLWYLFLAFLAVPFLPLNVSSLPSVFPHTGFSPGDGVSSFLSPSSGAPDTSWLQDFSVSVSRKTPESFWMVLGAVWILGAFLFLVSALFSALRLARLRRSALPLESREVLELYESCLEEFSIARPVSVYTTAWLPSPVLAGIFRPCILLPLSLLEDCPASSLRHMFLHELAHWKRRDNLVSLLVLAAGILYWFHPAVYFAFRQMQREREIACDSMVMELLSPGERTAYGHTLLDFAQNAPSFSFTACLGSPARQLKQRLLAISGYRPVTRKTRRQGRLLFALVLALFLLFVPWASFSVAETSTASWKPGESAVTTRDFSAFFPGEQEGQSFVLWNLGENTWTVYGEEDASRRVSPDSTYKIFSAAAALEEGSLSPSDTGLSWDGSTFPFPEWNQDQTLSSAMSYSVNWYFQELDTRTGLPAIQKALKRMDYGNQDTSGGLSSFWLESSLKISPMEQVRFLGNLCQNTFQLPEEHLQLLRDSLRLQESGGRTLYGKTGTGQVEEKTVNGWFVGFVEDGANAWCFASHIQGEDQADGQTAAQCALDILTALGLWA